MTKHQRNMHRPPKKERRMSKPPNTKRYCMQCEKMTVFEIIRAIKHSECIECGGERNE
jgi:hypothetical protein|tara:strand:- start:5855 stop:6028 length:174 start_codon:yes stop_codon:yes gene_type:complete